MYIYRSSVNIELPGQNEYDDKTSTSFKLNFQNIFPIIEKHGIYTYK